MLCSLITQLNIRKHQDIYLIEAPTLTLIYNPYLSLGNTSLERAQLCKKLKDKYGAGWVEQYKEILKMEQLERAYLSTKKEDRLEDILVPKSCSCKDAKSTTCREGKSCSCKEANLTC